MIKDFFGKTVVVRRLRTVSGYKKSFRATATCDCAIQDMDILERTQRGIVGSRSWVAYFDIDQDLREGDSITDSNSTLYKVREVTKKDYGINQHLEVVLEEYND
jgi:hypothetical protein